MSDTLNKLLYLEVELDAIKRRKDRGHAATDIAKCSGKAAFESKSLALEVNRRMRRNGKAVSPYLCGECGKWHMGGSKDKRGRRRG